MNARKKSGDVREDGYVFHCYYKTKTGAEREHWLHPDVWAKKQARRREVSRESARRCRQKPETKNYQREYQREYSRKVRATQPGVILLRSAKQRAKAKGLAFDLTVEDIHVPDTCPVLGIPLTLGGYKARDSSPSLDRVDNSGGYTKGNVIVVSMRANQIKRDATVEELNKVAAFYTELSKEK